MNPSNPSIPFDQFNRLSRQYPTLGLTITAGENALVNWAVPKRGTLTLRYRNCNCCPDGLQQKNQRAERKLLGHLLESIQLLGMQAVMETGNTHTPARAKLTYSPPQRPTVDLTGFHDGNGPLELEDALVTALLEAGPEYHKQTARPPKGENP